MKNPAFNAAIEAIKKLHREGRMFAFAHREGNSWAVCRKDRLAHYLVPEGFDILVTMDDDTHRTIPVTWDMPWVKLRYMPENSLGYQVEIPENCKYEGLEFSSDNPVPIAEQPKVKGIYPYLLDKDSRDVPLKDIPTSPAVALTKYGMPGMVQLPGYDTRIEVDEITDEIVNAFDNMIGVAVIEGGGISIQWEGGWLNMKPIHDEDGSLALIVIGKGTEQEGE